MAAGFAMTCPCMGFQNPEQNILMIKRWSLRECVSAVTGLYKISGKERVGRMFWAILSIAFWEIDKELIWYPVEQGYFTSACLPAASEGRAVAQQFEHTLSLQRALRCWWGIKEGSFWLMPSSRNWRQSQFSANNIAVYMAVMQSRLWSSDLAHV